MKSEMGGALFSHFVSEANKNLSSRIRHWLSQNLVAFTTAILSSIVFHLGLFYFFSIPVNVSRESRHEIQAENSKPLSLSLRNIREKFYAEPQVNKLSRQSLERVSRSFTEQKNAKGKVDKQSKDIRNKRLNDVYSKSKDNDSGDQIGEYKTQIGEYSPLSTSGEDNDYVGRFKIFKKDQMLVGARQVRVQTEEGTQYIPAEYFFRKPPYEELVSFGADLFTIIEGFPDLGTESSSSPGWRDEKKSYKSEDASSKFQEILIDGQNIDLKGHLSHTSEMTASPLSLIITDQKYKEVLDGLMPFSETEQFQQFKQNFLEQYDPESRDLTDLTAEFIGNNLTNVFILISDISAAFDFVEEIYFNKELRHQFHEYWKQHPQSSTGAVFLMSMAAQYNFERKALIYLFKAYGDAKEFLEGKQSEVEIHNKEAKCYVIRKIGETLVQELEKKGYSSMGDVLTSYVEEEKKIYSQLIEMGGEQRNMGLFAQGCLDWEGMHYEVASRSWKMIDEDYTANKALQEIRQVLVKGNNDYMDRMISQVDAILEYHSNKSNKGLLLRLVKYGRWKSREE